MSRLARALWIEICYRGLPAYRQRSRGSREPCGLKSFQVFRTLEGLESRLARALWIEMIWNTSGGPISRVEARESLVD